MNKKLLVSTIIGSVLFPAIVSAQVTTTPAISSTSTPTNTVERDFTICSKTSKTNRDTIIKAANDAYRNAKKAALSVRKDAQKVAESNTDKTAKKDALKAAADTYRAAIKDAQKILLQARKDAKASYSENRKSCLDAKRVAHDKFLADKKIIRDKFLIEKKAEREANKKIHATGTPATN